MKYNKLVILSLVACVLVSSLNLNAAISLKGSSFLGKTCNFSGDLNAEESLFAGVLTNNGNILGKKSQFQNDMTIIDGNIILEDCSTKNITVKNSKEDYKFLLIGDTKIDGNITFVGNKGKVLATEKVKISGKIENAELVKISTKDLEKYYQPKK